MLIDKEIFKKALMSLINGKLKRKIVYKSINSYMFIGENLKFSFYGKDSILLEGYGGSLSIGGAINILIVEYLSGKKVILAEHISKEKIKGRHTYSVIGSIL